MRTLTRRQRIAGVALAAVCLLFISLDFTGSAFAEAHDGVSGAFGSLYRGTDSVLGPLRRFLQGIPQVGRNRSQIAQLRQQNDQLRRELTQQKLDQRTARQLQALQLQADSADWKIIPGRVIATNPGAGFSRTLTVDAGSIDGVADGQTVTDGRGLLGRVVEVHSTTAVVLLVTDPEFGVGVRDTRTGTLLLGKGTAGADLRATSLAGVTAAAVRAGDVMSTGPAGDTTFVAGIEVGTVTSVTTGAGGIVTANVRPTVSQSSADIVAIVLTHPRTTARPALGGGG
jgi:rod shape-determining protein MreC